MEDIKVHIRFVLDLWEDEKLWYANYITEEYEFPDDGGIVLANAIARFTARYAQKPQITQNEGWPEVTTEIPPPIMGKRITPGMKFIIKSVIRIN